MLDVMIPMTYKKFQGIVSIARYIVASEIFKYLIRLRRSTYFIGFDLVHLYTLSCSLT